MWRFNCSICFKKNHKGIFYMTACHMGYMEYVYSNNEFKIHFTGWKNPNF